MGRIDEIKTKTEEEFIEKLHDASMNRDDPFKALQARLLKEVGPALVRWIHIERERNTNPRDIAQAASVAILNLIIAVAGVIARSGREEAVTEGMILCLIKAYNHLRDEQPANLQFAEGKKE